MSENYDVQGGTYFENYDDYGDVVSGGMIYDGYDDGGWAGSSTVICSGCGREVRSAYDTCPYCGTYL
ncbi:MAG: hypothetical protein J6T99_06035 [Oscillospiraceae bacterium]|nr:hypothetical protein [Oscillospiraceae bacterium]